MSETDGKTDRLAAALRANLARRKAQARARRDAEPGPVPNGEAGAEELSPTIKDRQQERIVSEDEAG